MYDGHMFPFCLSMDLKGIIPLALCLVLEKLEKCREREKKVKEKKKWWKKKKRFKINNIYIYILTYVWLSKNINESKENMKENDFLIFSFTMENMKRSKI